ncbi:UNVERIFIED_CONTAM: hypothetical protein RMT77_001180 [Armadillidium vulgare]
MEITVCSVLEGKASGYIVFRVSSDTYVGDLLKRFCKEKNVPVAKDYVLCGRGNATLDPHKTLKQECIKDEDTLKLTQEDKNEQLFAFGSWWVIALLAFLMGSIGITYSLYMFLFPQKLPQKYGLVIDAGSSHSQLFVFTWSKPEKKTMADIELIHGCYMHGGVHNYRFRTEGLQHYFTPCINEAKNLIPVSLIPQTPLILAATAGMRILRAYDPEGATLVLSSIREVFWSKTKFLINHKDVFVASGQEEGISGWTALNYLMENFDEEDSQVSALDLGGASVQVTTELSKGSKHWPSVNITIFNNTYRVFSKSFLCYGIEEAKHRYQYLLFSELLNNTHNNVIFSPCLPAGLEMSFTSEDFYSPCIFSNDTKIYLHPNYLSRYAKKYVSGYSSDSNNHIKDMTKKKKKRNYLLKGTSDRKLCQEKVKSLFDYELCKKNFVLGDCLNKKLVPPYKGELVGFSSIFHRLLPLLGVSQEGSLEEFRTSVLSVCGKSKETVFEFHPNISIDMLEDLCFDGMYVYTLLKEGLGITAKRWKNILFTNKVHEQDVVWAMGLMLNRTSTNLSYAQSRKMGLVTFVALVAIFIFFIILSLLFLWYSLKLKQRGNLYQRVPMRIAEEA